MKKIVFLILIFFASYNNTLAFSDIPQIQDRSTWENIDVGDHFFYNANLEKKINIPKKYQDIFKEKNFPIPEYSKVKRIIIHDTGCCNEVYSDEKRLIQMINKDHSIVRGWGDIGYNYIIDKNGNIYKGRSGKNGKRGAHAYNNATCSNFNVGTIGIALIGDYAHKKPNEKTLNSLYKLVGWLSATNSIDPQKKIQTPIWKNPKFQGECVSKYGGRYQGYFFGPTILGHKDVEHKNTDPGLLDMEKLRKEAEKLKKIYENYTYTSEGYVFKIKNGYKYPVKYTNNAIFISKSQANIFPFLPNKYKDGTLVKTENKPYIFLIEGDKKRHISSLETFQKMKLSFSDVVVLNEGSLKDYKMGKPININEKNTPILVRKDGGKRVYLLDNGKLRWIKTYEIFQKRGYKMKNVLSLNAEEMAEYEFSDPIYK